MEGVIQAQEKPHKKVWIISFVVILIVLILAFVVVLKIKSNNELKKININSLKFTKCYSSCPYAEKISSSGASFLSPVEECMHACDDKYGGVYGGATQEQIKKYSKELVTNKIFIECNLVRDLEVEYKNCMNNIIEVYSYIIDLSDFEPDIEYEVVDIKIEEATCGENSAEIKVKLNQGDSLEGIVFVFNSGGDIMIIKRAEVPLLGELKEYNIPYSENEDVANGEIVVSPESVGVSVVVNRRTTDIKDYFDC
tara:strand:+ start:672 stop:1430 length:759 start_codon:yes stop_codon:yes gene_type:complete